MTSQRLLDDEEECDDDDDEGGVTSKPISSMGSILVVVAPHSEQVTIDSTLPRNNVKGYSSSSALSSWILSGSVVVGSGVGDGLLLLLVVVVVTLSLLLF